MHSRLALVACALALVAVPAIVLAGGAGGADGGPETAAATVDTPNGSVISLAPSNGSNGQYASLNADDELQLQFDELNENATTTADDVFVITVTAASPVALRIEDDAPGVGFYWAGDPAANASEARTVQPGDTVAVGVRANSFGAIDDGNFSVVAEEPTQTGGSGGFSIPPDNEGGDLTVVDADVSPTEIAVGESATATAMVVNGGDAAASETIELAIDGTVVDQQTVTVDGGDSATVSFDRTFQQTGEFAVSVGGMDAGTVSVSAGSGPAATGFSVANASLSPSVIQPGGTTTISANVTNHDDTATFFQAELAVGGVVVEQRPVRIGPGETVQVSFERSFDRRGGYDVAISGAAAGTVRVEDSTTTSMRRYGSEYGWLLGAATIPTLGGAFVAARRRRQFLDDD